jgi:radical SAM protein with 4Fe4S-binding SPASM domain
MGLLKQKLRTVEFEVTNHCTSALKFGQCKFCYSKSGEKLPNELPQSERCNVIRKLAEIGVSEFLIGGGEPFDIGVDELIGMVQLAKDYGMRVFITTSGINSSDIVLGRLSKLDVDGISVSLDGSSSQIHGLSRPSKTFELAIKTLETCVKNNLWTYISMTISKYNVNDFNNMLKLALNLKVNGLYTLPVVRSGCAYNLGDILLSPQEKADHITQVVEASIQLNPEFMIETSAPQKTVVKFNKALTQKILVGCTAGITDLGILPDGTIVDCPIHRMKLGNITLDNIEDIWLSHEKLLLLRNRKNLKGKCGMCKYRDICGGCRAEASAVYGEYLAEDPTCAFFEER